MNRFFTTLFCVAFSFSAFPQAGDLDTDFSGDGIVHSPISGYGQSTANDIAIQDNGKIVIAGLATNGASFISLLMRYNTDGTLDNSFGTNGLVKGTNFSGDNGFHAMALQSDGKILATGYLKESGTDNFLLARYSSTGALDNTFDSDGFTTWGASGSIERANDIALQTDGKIVLAGEKESSGNYAFALTRYNSNGSLDNSFDNDGAVTTTLGGTDNRARALAIQNDGKIIAAGQGDNGSDIDLGFARYETNGSLDNSFGTNGTFLSNNSFSETVHDIALQPDGKILACGYIVPGGFYVLRLKTDGSLDTSFATGGIRAEFDINSIAWAVTVQADGKILVAGSTFANGTGSTSDVSLRRYKSNGDPDSTFGTNGVVSTNINNGDQDAAKCLAIQDDDKIVTAGTGGVSSSIQTDVILTRYKPGTVITGITENAISGARVFPNPVTNNQTKLRYHIEESQILTIQLLDMQGRVMQVFTENETQTAGKQQKVLQLSGDLPSGQYVLQLKTESGLRHLPLILIN